MAGSLPWLKTVGNKIVTEGGQEVILRGANIINAEWVWLDDKSMDWENKAIPEFADTWHANVLVRGFASDPVNSGDADYLKELDTLVLLAEQKHMYLMFAWRSLGINGEQEPMPKPAATSALSTLAARYKSKSHVLYALQVEPHDDNDHGVTLDWTTLRLLFENMVDAIRSAADPTHEPLVMIPGTDWSRDLRAAMNQPVNRTNVVYKTHPYGSWTQFQQWFGDAFSGNALRNPLPVFIGEFGPDVTNGMTMKDVRVLLELTRKCHIGWAAWVLDYATLPPPLNLMTSQTDLSPSQLIGTTSEEYGVTVQDELLNHPPSAPGETLSIDDSLQGTDPHQWQYQGAGWQHCTDCDELTVTYHNASQSWTKTPDDTAHIIFFGRQIKYFGAVAPWHGIAAVSVDGGTETMVDLYALTKTGDVSLWTSPLLAPGIHTFTLRATGDKNADSSDSFIVLDRVAITVWV